MRKLKGLVFLMMAVPLLAHASVTVTVNGSNHTIPQTNERGWGNAVTAWIQAISTYSFQPTGGVFTLSADADFGGSYGLKTSYLSTRAANPSTSGLLRLAKTDTIGWRNNANGGNLLLAIDGSDNLTFNGVVVSGSSALTASRAMVTNGSGTASTSSVTSTELGYLSGVTSALQTQIDGKQATGNYITALTGDITASGPGSVAATIGAGKVTNAMLAGSIDLTSKVTGTLPAASGGTGSSSYTKGDILAASAATTLAKLGVGADGTVLTADSAQATGLKWGTALSNPMSASGDIIVGGASGAATRLAKGTDGQYLRLNSGTPAWETPTAPTVTKYTSGSGTYTPPTGAKWLRILMVGGGAGGSGSGTSGGGGGNSSGMTDTTFGTGTAGAGGAGSFSTGVGGVGGTATLGTGWLGVAVSGGGGGGQVGSTFAAGGVGGASYLSGGGRGGGASAGGTPPANSGAGGGGGGYSNASSGFNGPGGGAGASIVAIIPGPLAASYSYQVGSPGSAGSAGTNGFAGAVGASGVIVIEENYN